MTLFYDSFSSFLAFRLLLSAFITALSAPMVEFKTALIYYYMIFFINFVLLKQWHLLLCIAIVNPIK